MFDQKTYNLIRDCLHPDRQNEGDRARYTEAFAAFNDHKKALLKPGPKPVRGQLQPVDFSAEAMARGRGEYDRKNRERAQKAAATRKAKKQPKRELGAH